MCWAGWVLRVFVCVCTWELFKVMGITAQVTHSTLLGAVPMGRAAVHCADGVWCDDGGDGVCVVVALGLLLYLRVNTYSHRTTMRMYSVYNTYSLSARRQCLDAHLRYHADSISIYCTATHNHHTITRHYSLHMHTANRTTPCWHVHNGHSV